MESAKRPSEVISPIQRDNLKNRRIVHQDVMAEEVRKLDEEIENLMEKPDPNIKDSMVLTSLQLKRDRLYNQWVLIPEMVNSLFEAKMTAALDDGGSVRVAIEEEVKTATAKMTEKVRVLEDELEGLKRANAAEIRQPRKWGKIIMNERARCIEASGKGLVIFEVEVLPGESAEVNDAQLETIVREITGDEEVVEWKRNIRGKKALHGWKGKKPPAISIRLQTNKARERVIQRARVTKKSNIKREIPDLLMEEFKELERDAEKLRKENHCQTYIGFGGSEIFLRRRKDSKDQWRTVKRL